MFQNKILCLFPKFKKMAKQKEKTTELLIVEHLEKNGQKMSWLAKQIGVSQGHLHSVLKGDMYKKRELTPENREKINTVLKTKF